MGDLAVVQNVVDDRDGQGDSVDIHRSVHQAFAICDDGRPLGIPARDDHGTSWPDEDQWAGLDDEARVEIA